MELEQYNLVVKHRKGKTLAHVDCLSRNIRQDDILEEPLAEKYITELPYEEDGVVWTQEQEEQWID